MEILLRIIDVMLGFLAGLLILLMMVPVCIFGAVTFYEDIIAIRVFELLVGIAIPIYAVLRLKKLRRDINSGRV